MNSIQSIAATYRNDKENNERIYTEFTNEVNKMPVLKEHRDHIEKNKLGFGDRAFHYMWYLLVQDVAARYPSPEFLEIGVYKGQVISLWAVLARQLGKTFGVTAISPLEGNFPKTRLINNRYVRRFLWMFNKKYRRDFKIGNNYEKEDYKRIIEELFHNFGEDLSTVKLFKGFSNDPGIVQEVTQKKYHLLYVDGDHSYEGALFDIQHYGSTVAEGGYMVMDDASFYLEGDNFWKGHEEVSRACEHIENLGFRHILAVGHNRVYQKL